MFLPISTILIRPLPSLQVQLLQSLPDSLECVPQPRQMDELPWLQRTTVKQAHSQSRTTVEPLWDCPWAVLVYSVFHSSLTGSVQRMETHSQQQLDSVWVLRPSHCLLVSVVEFTPRRRTLVPISSEKSRQVFLKTTHVTLVSSLTTSVTTSVTLLEWVLTSSNPLLVQSLLL